MVGAGSVVTRRLRRIVADEDGSCIADVHQVFFIHGNVLGGNTVGKFQSLLVGVGHQNCAVFFEGAFGDLIICRG